MLGQTISHYRIIEKVGGGGMGVVYKAEDIRLHRFVALKFLPDELVKDTQALPRFQREAQAASALNHPNICTIYDVGEQDGQYFIAMELLEGQTLQARIAGRPLPLETFLDLALQIADALEAAHKRSIIHRDLKPSNVFVTSRGDAKLLDFGLAKHLHIESVPTADTPTFSGPITVRGQIVGTIAYMSPEQVQDKITDSRSDIFSFGGVLYEMATGRCAFAGESTASVIAEVLRGEPKSAKVLNPAIPDELQRVIGKALEKDPSDRYQSANDLMIDLRRLKRQTTGSSHTSVAIPTPPMRFNRLRTRSVWILAIAAVVLLAFLIVAVNTPSPVSGPLHSEQITFSTELKDGPLVTDGNRLYFQSQDHPVEMSVTGGASAPLRASVSGMTMLDISPDASEMLALKADLNNEIGLGSIWSVPVLGGYPKRVGSQIALAARWSPDGRSIVFSDLSSVYLSGRDGANWKKIWETSGRVGRPCFSPDSRRIRMTVFRDKVTQVSKIWEMNADGSNPHQLALDWPQDADQDYGQWTPDGKRFIFRSTREGVSDVYEIVPPPWFEIWKTPTAVRLTSGQLEILATTPSRDSTGLFIIGKISQGAMHVYDPIQKRFVPFLNGLAASRFVISPDKKWMVYTDYPRHYLWRSKLDGSEKLELTDFPSAFPSWSPDSKKIAFSDVREIYQRSDRDKPEIYQVSVDGGSPEKLTSEGGLELSPSWWPDGKSIAFMDFPVPGQKIKGIKVLDLSTRRVAIMPHSEGFYGPLWSPDGQHLIAVAQDPSRIVLYSAQEVTWKVLKEFEFPWGFPVWSSDSKSIYVVVNEVAPGAKPGIYRLAIADGSWTQATNFDGLTFDQDPFDDFPSLTLEGQPALMNDTSVVQIYLAKWAEGSGLH
jgi:serine/threonine protein kinase/Tol biopolymer transport system component